MVKLGLGLRTLSLAVAAFAAVAACSEDEGPPTGFGVNVIVNASMVPAATRTAVVRGRLTATGVTAAPTVHEVQLGEAIDSGEVRFRFVPAAQAGTLTLALEALDGAGAVLASGVGAPVALVAGKAVEVRITLTAGGTDGGVMGDAPINPEGKVNGEACTAAAECKSNICADGVCCNAACNGTCESCALAATRGSCEPIPDDTDPQNECGPAMDPVPAPLPDGGADAGAAPSDGGPSLNVPDGGLQRMQTKCGGKCNGKRQCKFPGTETSCGAKWCNGTAQPAAMTCNGAGSCEPTLTSCSAYACNSGACRVDCAGPNDCQTATHYCAIDNTCKLKKQNGVACRNSGECQSGACANIGPSGEGVCCNSACEAPLNCTTVPGKCQCPGVTCAAGVACQLFYRDGDVDGFGDVGGTLGNGNAKAGCQGAPPAGFVANNTDCDDGDANVRPGQTAFFDVPSKGKGTYDYNCDGAIAKADFEGVGSLCKFFSGQSDCSTYKTVCSYDKEPGGVACRMESSFTRGVAAIVADTFVPGPIIIVPFFRPVAKDGFISTVNCGTLGSFRVCGTCNLAGQGAVGAYNYNKKQACN